MFCSNCGNKIQDDAHYCSVCGHKVVDDGKDAPKENSPDQDPSEEINDSENADVTGTVPTFISSGLPTYPPNANVPPVVPKETKWSKIWIAALVLLVLVLGAVVIAWLL